MNKHGQTLILFVILIPIILLLLAFVVDIGLVITNKIKTEEVTKQVIKDAYLLDDNKIIELLQKNKINTSNINIYHEDNKLKIVVKQEIKSIFGGIVGIKKYKINVSVTGIIENDKVNFL